jgi:hypothetical protein
MTRLPFRSSKWAHFCASVLCTFALALQGHAQVNLLTQHNDNARSGANLHETTLNTSNVNASRFGKLFSRTVDGQMYAQPLVVCSLDIPGKGRRDVVFLATEHNSVYAFDADDPKAAAPFWHVNLGPSCPYTDFYKTEWTDMNDEVGITSTPVIDPRSRTLYVEAKTKENGRYFQRLHELDLLTGEEKPGSPVTIAAQVKGTGLDAVNGVVSFNPFTQLQRPGLLLSNGVVYLAFGSHADTEPFHGWMLGYDARTLKQVFVWNTTPDGSEGAIWQAGQGLAADASGYIYASLGNGDADAQTGGRDYGECLVRIDPKAKGSPVADWFMPFNFADLNQNDGDFGSSGPLLVSGTNILVTGSKEDVIYVVQRNAMGHFHKADDAEIIQDFPGGNGHVHGAPVVWLTPDNGRIMYVWTENDNLRSYKWQDGKFVPFKVGPTRLPYGMPGGFLSLSADGSRAGTGIIWASHPYDDNANWKTVPGELQAFDAADPMKELWNSRMNLTRDDLGMFAKFCPPTVVNGRVYLATFSKQLVVYGLLPKAPGAAVK